VLERRLGFRAEAYGLRQVFPRIPDHPLLAGVRPEYLRDWRGEATTLPPRFTYEMRPQHGPTIKWCDIPVSRVWRCGNRGDVASALIEKPARGDFRPILDGGYSLQFSPLMEYHEGKGLVIFCQLDVTGRTEPDPAARTLAGNLLRYAATWKPEKQRKAVYVGEAAGKEHLPAAGIEAAQYDGGNLSPDEQVLILGPGAGKQLAGDSAASVKRFVEASGRLLAVGVDQQDVDALLPFKVTLRKAEHIATTFDAPAAGSLLAGVGPADVHNRDPRELPLVAGGATVLGDGVLALAPAGAERPNVVFCQLAPWQFDPAKSSNLKRTFRRSSFLLTRLMGNMGVAARTALLERFHQPTNGAAEARWKEGLYLDTPEEWDDPYRFFRW
jgi:beta-galactosidase